MVAVDVVDAGAVAVAVCEGRICALGAIAESCICLLLLSALQNVLTLLLLAV